MVALRMFVVVLVVVVVVTVVVAAAGGRVVRWRWCTHFGSQFNGSSSEARSESKRTLAR